jgi:hypothetical protein
VHDRGPVMLSREILVLAVDSQGYQLMLDMLPETFVKNDASERVACTHEGLIVRLFGPSD